jgi:hypothetical protein
MELKVSACLYYRVELTDGIEVHLGCAFDRVLTVDSHFFHTKGRGFDSHLPPFHSTTK